MNEIYNKLLIMFFIPFNKISYTNIRLEYKIIPKFLYNFFDEPYVFFRSPIFLDSFKFSLFRVKFFDTNKKFF